MSEGNAARAYGVRVGLLSGLFAIGQVAISAAAAHGSEAALRAIQQAFAILAAGSIADPTTLIPALIPMLAVSYLSMLAVGLLTVWFAGRAGRLAAIAQGRRANGGSAGMWVWVISTSMWLVASVVITAITNTDGTLSGVFAGTFSPTYLPQELIFLLLQEVLAALVCLGFCALAGSRGARNAPLLVSDTAQPPPLGAPIGVGFPPPGAYPYPPYAAPGYGVAPGYPPYPPYPGYPAYPGYPPAPWGAPPQAPQPPAQPPTQPLAPPMPPMQGAGSIPYPPPPSFYMPQLGASAQGEPPTAPAPTTPAPQPE